MNRAKIREEIETDLRRSPSLMIVYLEGETDVQFLFALLGRWIPPGDVTRGILCQNTLVKPCGGATAVKARLEVASSFRHGGSILGVIDGDGLPLESLKGHFDHPHSGPLFMWKAYCIENLLAKTGWPSTWGEEPDWRAVYLGYGPYVAFNRIHSDLILALQTLEITSFVEPKNNEPLRTDVDMLVVLDNGKHLIRDFDVAERFRAELLEFYQVLDRDLDEVHARLNGKWLIQHLAHLEKQISIDKCRNEWIAHAQSIGGLPEVRDWWQRVTGNPP